MNKFNNVQEAYEAVRDIFHTKAIKEQALKDVDILGKNFNIYGISILNDGLMIIDRERSKDVIKAPAKTAPLEAALCAAVMALHDYEVLYNEIYGWGVNKIFDKTNHKRGYQRIVRFKNGYGASIVQHSFSYGGDEGLYELAVIRFKYENSNDDFELVYDTPITNDVIGWLNIWEIDGILRDISELPNPDI